MRYEVPETKGEAVSLLAMAEGERSGSSWGNRPVGSVTLGDGETWCRRRY